MANNCTYIDITPGFDTEFGHADKCPADETVRTLQRGWPANVIIQQPI